MKLDQLLKESGQPLKDDGFTDRVMRSLPRPPVVAPIREPWIVRMLDLSSLEILGSVLALILLSAYAPSVREVIVNSLFTTLGALMAMGLALAYWFSEGELL